MTHANCQPTLSLMRLLRLILMLVLAGSLAASPVLSVAAMAQAATAEAAVANMGEDCPCCDHEPAKGSSAVCCHMMAMSAGALVMQGPATDLVGDGGQDAFVGVVARPEPPPPRTELA